MRFHPKIIVTIPAVLFLLCPALFTACQTDSGSGGGGFTAENVRCPISANGAPEAILASTCIETLDFAGPSRARAGLLRSLRWNKSVLKVRFMNGEPQVHERVKRYANQWSTHCGIKFDFGNHHPADIRISFTCGGHWSRVGSGTSDLADNQPTMNLTRKRSTSDGEVRRVTLHEFGHALGLIHEHQSPAGGIRWNEPAVLDFYSRTQGWGPETTRRNVLTRYSTSSVNASVFDPRSIMLYPIPRDLTLDGFHTESNTELSPQDIAFIGAIYPKTN